MRVLFVSSEVSPYSKSGGLGDVAGALPARLREMGIDVLTVTPRYGRIDPAAHRLVPHSILGEHELTVGSRRFRWSGFQARETNTVFIEIPELYHRDEIYTDDPDEHVRFATLGLAALEVCRLLRWRPDVVHCNDWQAGLVPVLLAGPYRDDPVVGKAASVLTVHNLGYQGQFPTRVAPEVGLYGYQHLLHHDLLPGDHLNFLASGLAWANLITTVSPTYAAEIQTVEHGAGLDHLLRARSNHLLGILNGIDTNEWNPRTDPLIPFRYSERSLWRKELCKRELCERMGLPYRKGVPVVGVVSRLVEQKGFDIVEAPFRHFLESWDLRLVVLGSGEPRFEQLFGALAADYPRRAAFVSGYDIPLSHLIEAGSDIFCMPSRYEPCGLNQMYSLAYGTVPVVRRVGGLADTVTHYDPEAGSGTGFVFEHYTPEGLGWALGRALTTHIDRRAWQDLQRAGMAQDNSWEARAADYQQAYRRALRARRGAPPTDTG